MEIIASQDGGPYACKIKLGWCIVGPIMSNKNGEALRCNRLAVKDAIAGKLLLHHFVTDPGCKLTGIGMEGCSGKSIIMNFVRKYIYQPDV